MHIGFVGLGKMGLNMVTRLMQGGHEVVVFDTQASQRDAAVRRGARAVMEIREVPKQLAAPRTVWLMVPAGEVTQRVLDELLPHLQAGDVVIDGGNSYFRDSIARATQLLTHGVHLLDVGTSGGVWGLQNGYCLMIGGAAKAYTQAEPAFRTLAPEAGYRHVGPAGAGHYAKMIHNAIEYGMMQAYGEGFAMLEVAQETMGYTYDLKAVGDLWNRGSVVRSWLLELLTQALAEDPRLSTVAGVVPDSGEGRWTAKEAIDAAVPAPVLTLALQMRFASRQPDAFAAKVCAALRQQFGGHAVHRPGEGSPKEPA